MPRTRPFDKHPDRYEEWFEKNRFAYLSEIEALRRFVPLQGRGLEVGVGTGRFAVPLGVREGVDPSPAMREFAFRRGIDVADGTAEHLPYPDASFNFVLMVTTVCFVDDTSASFREAYRVTKPGGRFIVGFVDLDSPLGKKYTQIKKQNVFYRDATFYSANEIIVLMRDSGFKKLEMAQTIFGDLGSIDIVQPVKEGTGEGGFVVIKGERHE